MQGWGGHSERCCDLEPGSLALVQPSLLCARSHLPCLGTKPLGLREAPASFQKERFSLVQEAVVGPAFKYGQGEP